MKVPFSILERQYKKYQNEYEEKALKVLRKGWYILGEECEKFEEEYANYVGTKYSLGIDNGLNALVLAFRALNIGKGDEVIVQGNTFIATVMGITINGATPIFIEPDEYYNIDTNKIEEKITNKTKAICVVHLYGQATEMDKILELCQKYNLKLVEDCAQAHGAKYNGQMVGSFGDIGCFSFYPGKNLGCFGDGGAITTNNKEIYDRIKMLRSYGSEKKYHHIEVGYNSRLDELQAGLLRIKLSHLVELTDEREKLTKKYLDGIKNPLVTLPKIKENCTHVWHLFVVRVENRDKFQKYLEENGIGTMIHYPIPPHLSVAYKELGYKVGDYPITEKYANTVLSLPLYNGMTEEEIDYVIKKINEYRG
ncbi:MULTISPECIES: DegT/DnrJ/EryC1/StrS aminotransferase family protein [Fusobacterium]|uniref:DegT/DnrJ/EryC1/StrS family aminotransferase n=1 Tax=Fusobacterium TaxID=848 RepID=UPI001476F3F3|nr:MULTISPECIES: DegT/DnrJ/EryC1/StrS family aminotransferase [Fusobacterium]NME35815.1 DegT/DnrJ/EryC1/StrS family aminotransferase [Fusobacterium sp. FSA-380-WT-3A]